MAGQANGVEAAIAHSYITRVAFGVLSWKCQSVFFIIDGTTVFSAQEHR